MTVIIIPTVQGSCSFCDRNTTALNLEYILPNICQYLSMHKDMQSLEDIHGVYICRTGVFDSVS